MRRIENNSHRRRAMQNKISPGQNSIQIHVEPNTERTKSNERKLEKRKSSNKKTKSKSQRNKQAKKNNWNFVFTFHIIKSTQNTNHFNTQEIVLFFRSVDVKLNWIIFVSANHQLISNYGFTQLPFNGK